MSFILQNDNIFQFNDWELKSLVPYFWNNKLVSGISVLGILCRFQTYKNNCIIWNIPAHSPSLIQYGTPLNHLLCVVCYIWGNTLLLNTNKSVLSWEALKILSLLRFYGVFKESSFSLNKTSINTKNNSSHSCKNMKLM